MNSFFYPNIFDKNMLSVYNYLEAKCLYVTYLILYIYLIY
jgi:hypothetical protein